MSRFLRFGALLCVLFFSANAFAAGYTCPTYKKYTSCNADYYVSECGTDKTKWTGQSIASTALQPGNSCIACPSGYTCQSSAGLVCPKASTVTCSPGTYLKANATSCTTCEAGYKCPGGTYTPSSSIHGRTACSDTGEYQNSTGQSTCKSVSDGYYKNGNIAQQVCGTGYFCKSGVRTACTTYGAGYTTGTTTASVNTSCYLAVAAGKVRSGTTGTTLSTCSAGTYKAAHNAYYGTTYTCDNCTGRTQYSGAGAGSCSTVTNGYYTTGCNTSNNNCTGQSQCTGATYCASGVQNNCPAQTDGWTRNGGTGWTVVTQCNQTKTGTAISNYCSAGVLKQNATSATAWGATAIATALQAKPGSIVSGQTCAQCDAGQYSAGGTATSCGTCANWTFSSAGAASCSNCPGLTNGWSKQDSKGTGWTTVSKCVQVSGTPTNCASGNLKQTATNSTTWGASVVNSALSANPKYYVNGTACSACPAGSYCTGGTAAATKCATGSYSAGTVSACTACGAGKTSATGATSASACTSCAAIANIDTWATSSWNTDNTMSNLCTVSTCNGSSYKNGNACPSCPSGYTANTETGKTQQSQCQISVSGGHYIGTAGQNSSNWGTCAAGMYKATHTVNYGSTSSCGACTGRTQYSAAGASACSSVSSGYYTTGCNTSNNNCTGQSQCTSGTYCSSGVQNQCPTADSGWTKASPAGSTAYTACYEYQTPANCASGSVKRAASSTSAYSSTITLNSTLESKAGYYASTTATSCTICPAGSACAASATAPSACTGATYSESDGAPSCTACPTATNVTDVVSYGYYNKGGTNDHTMREGCYANFKASTITNGSVTAYHCYIDEGSNAYGLTATGKICWVNKAELKCNAKFYNTTFQGSGTQSSAKTIADLKAGLCVTVEPGYWSAADSVTREQCPANYRVGAAGEAQSDCQTKCAAGSRVGTANAACAAITSGNVYMLEHTVNYGKTSAAASNCPNGYTIAGTTQADHDEKSDCKTTCLAGYWVETPDAQCKQLSGVAKYSAQHTVAAGSKSDSNVKSCPTATSNWTAGTGTGWKVFGDCYQDRSATAISANCYGGNFRKYARSASAWGETVRNTATAKAGARINLANTTCVVCSGNTYQSKADGFTGETCSDCVTNYKITGTALADHDAAADCKITCSGGSYIAAANNTSCSNVGIGYWAAASTVSQGSAGVRNQCDAGLTTIGSGAGADEAGDCGRVLHVGDSKLYLRSEPKTTPSLNVGINGTTFYGNMGHDLFRTMSYDTDRILRVSHDNNIYTVYDDTGIVLDSSGGGAN